MRREARILILGAGLVLGSLALACMVEPSILPPPSNLVRTAFTEDPRSITLSWVDNADNTTSFVVEKSNDGGLTWVQVDSTPANVTSAVVSLGSGDTFPYFRVYVFSMDIMSISEFSNVISIEGTDPTTADTDDDGMLDSFEVAHGLDPYADDAYEDADGDRYPNIFEYARGSDVNDAGSVPAIDYIADGSNPPSGNSFFTIQAALDQVAADYQIVEVRGGTYSGSGNVNLTVSATHAVLLIGEKGAGGTILDGGGTARLLTAQGETVVDGFTFRNGAGSEGGALYAVGGNLLVVNCVFSGNEAAQNGGALYQAAGSTMVIHSTLLNNLAGGEGAAAYVEEGYLGIAKSILWNSGTGVEVAASGTGASVEITESIIRGGFPGTGNLSGNPLARPEGHLTVSSPAIDSGGILQTALLDMDGEERPEGSTTDIGADEWVDTDADGLPDWWELDVFGSLAAAGSGDPDGDGLTNVQEYGQGSDPTDYYSQGSTTHQPMLSIVGGDKQAGLPGAYLEEPLTVEVRSGTGGTLLVNAPVNYTVTSGSGGLAMVYGGTSPTGTMQVHTGSDGRAQVHFKQPGNAKVSSTIAVTSGTAGPVEFTERTSESDGLWAHWAFSENMGSIAADATGLTVSGTLMNQMQWAEGFDGGSGVKFSGFQTQGGSNAYVTMGNPGNRSLDFGKGSFSITLWVKFTNVSKPTTPTNWGRRIVTKGHHGWNSGYFIGTGNNSGQIWVGIGSTQSGNSSEALLFGTTEHFNDGQWHHLAVTFDQIAARARIYVDGRARELVQDANTGGELDSEDPTVMFYPMLGKLSATQSAQPLVIGSHLGSYDFYHGELDDLRFYRKPLSEVEVAAVYNEDKDEDGLPDWWEFRQFGTLTEIAEGNVDGDQWNNFEEFERGLDPNFYDGVPKYILIEENGQYHVISHDLRHVGGFPSLGSNARICGDPRGGFWAAHALGGKLALRYYNQWNNFSEFSSNITIQQAKAVRWSDQELLVVYRSGNENYLVNYDVVTHTWGASHKLTGSDGQSADITVTGWIFGLERLKSTGKIWIKQAIYTSSFDLAGPTPGREIDRLNWPQVGYGNGIETIACSDSQLATIDKNSELYGGRVRVWHPGHLADPIQTYNFGPQLSSTYGYYTSLTLLKDGRFLAGSGKANSTITEIDTNQGVRHVDVGVPLFASSNPGANDTGNTVEVSDLFGDTDADGLPDVWELDAFGSLTAAGSGDLDGDGLTNVQEYEQGSDPTDYFSQGSLTITPYLAKLSGDSQSGQPGQYLGRPLVVEVRNGSGSGALLQNAPVTFAVTTGSSGLSSQLGDATTVSSLSVATGTDGRARVFLKQGMIIENSSITAASGTASVVFQATSPVEDGLWSRWPFSEGTGSVTADTTNLTVSGTLAGGATWTERFTGQNALSFSGTGQFVSMGDAASLDLGEESFSVAFWVKYADAPSSGNTMRIVSKGNTNWGTGYFVGIRENGKLASGMGTASGTQANALLFRTTGTFNNNEWRHVAVVYNRTAATARIYVDGEAQELEKESGTGGTASGPTLSYTGLEGLSASGTGSSFSVASSNGANDFFSGAVDDVRIYRKVLSGAAVDNLRNADDDTNGLPDWWEARHLGAAGADPEADADEDGLSNIEEYYQGTNPADDDTDGDGMADRWEVQFGFDPLDNADAAGDADGDGLTNLQEFQQESDPTDYYSQGSTTVAPVLSIVSGNEQAGNTNAYLAEALTVEVRSGSSTGALLSNAPVTYSVAEGGGRLAMAFGGTTTHPTLELRTGTNGQAAAWYKQGPQDREESTISVTSGTAAPVEFTAWTLDLVGHWKLDEGSGTAAADSGPFEFSGTLVNGPQWSSRYPGENALTFSGSNEHVLVASGTGGELDFEDASFTVTAWVRTGTAPAAGRILSKGNENSDPGYYLAVTADGQIESGLGTVHSGTAAETIRIKTTGSFNDDTWHAVAAVYDRANATARIYVDGTARQIAKEPGTGGTVTVSGSTSLNYSDLENLSGSRPDKDLTLASQSGTSAFFAGSLDETRLYRKALSAEEILDLHRQEGELTAVAGELTIPEDTLGTLTLQSHGGGDAPATFEIVTTSTNGTTELTGASVNYFPNAHFSSTDSFRFRVTKGPNTAEADVAIIVTPVNDPPLVSVGGGQSVTMSGTTATLALSATVTDIDTDPEDITLTWMKASGTGTVTFSGTNPLAATATFDAPGEYTLRLSAFDGSSTRSDSLAVVVNPSGANALPTVTFEEPANNTAYDLAEPIVLKTEASADTGLSVAKVEFYEGSRKIGEVTTPDGTSGLYELSWTPPRLGAYRLSARVTDSAGGVSFSSSIQTRVTDAGWFTDIGTVAGNEGYAGSGGNGGVASGSSTGTGSNHALGTGGNGGGASSGGGGDGQGNPRGSDPSTIDSDGDGLTDAEEEEIGTNPGPGGEDSDEDGVDDSKDGWPLEPKLAPKRIAKVRYALIEMGEGWGLLINNKCEAVYQDATNALMFWNGIVSNKIVDGNKLWKLIGVTDDGTVVYNGLSEPWTTTEYWPPGEDNLEAWNFSVPGRMRTTGEGHGRKWKDGSDLPLGITNHVSTFPMAEAQEFLGAFSIFYEFFRQETFAHDVSSNGSIVGSITEQHSINWVTLDWEEFSPESFNFNYENRFANFSISGWNWSLNSNSHSVGNRLILTTAPDLEDDLTKYISPAYDGILNPVFISESGIVVGRRSTREYIEYLGTFGDFFEMDYTAWAYTSGGELNWLTTNEPNVQGISSDGHIISSNNLSASFLINDDIGFTCKNAPDSSPSYSKSITWLAGDPNRPPIRTTSYEEFGSQRGVKMNSSFQIVGDGVLWENGRRREIGSELTGCEIVTLSDIDENGVIVGTIKKTHDSDGNEIPSSEQKLTAMMLVPFEVVPNPVPISGVARGKVVYGSGFEMPEDISDISIKIGGRPVKDIHQDEKDPHIIYFTPPPAPDGEAGEYDLEISGIEIEGFPTNQPNGVFKLEKYIKYTDDVKEGVDGFTASTVVSIEEAEHFVDDAKERESLSDGDAGKLFSSFGDVHAATQMGLFKQFSRVRTIDSSDVQHLRSVISGKLVKIGKKWPPTSGFSPAPDYHSGVQAKATDVEAVEGQTVGKILISRPTATSTQLTVYYTISGEATEGVDFPALSGQVTIAANELSAEVLIAPSQDGDIGQESVILTISENESYDVGFYDKATVLIEDASGSFRSNEGRRRFRFVSNPAPEGEEEPPRLGTLDFFPDIKKMLAGTTKKVVLGGARYNYPGYGQSDPLYYLAFDAKSLQLNTFVVGVAGRTIDDVIDENQGASIIINGAQCNFNCKNGLASLWQRTFKPDAQREPLQTIGQVVKSGQIQHPTSSTENKGSWNTAKERWWFGQTMVRTPSANGTAANSYRFGGEGNPPSDVYDGVGGLVSLIVEGHIQTVEDDADLGVYEPFHYSPIPTPGEFVGFNIIAVDRNTGIMMILTKQNLGLLSLGTVANILKDSGVDWALVTDGGGSTACWSKDYGFLSKSDRHQLPPNDANTITNYLIFSPTGN